MNNSGLIGAVSTQASGTTGAGTTPPAQVTGLTATTASSTQLNLAWTANASTDNVTNYHVYRSTTNGFTVNTATDTPIAQPTTNSYSNTGLTASTTYYYRVAACEYVASIGNVSAQASGNNFSICTQQNQQLNITSSIKRVRLCLMVIY